MSKSRKGNVVRTETILDAFGDHVFGKQFPDSTKQQRDLFAADVLRYFLLREIPFGQDGSFSFDALVTRYNADLANGYGNLVSRTLNMIQSYFDGSISKFEQDPDLSLTHNQSEASRGERPDVLLSVPAMNVAAIDAYITANAPWKLAKIEGPEARSRLADVLGNAANAVFVVTKQLYPFLPYTTAKVWAQLGLGDIELAAKNGDLKNLEWGGLKPGTKLGPLAPIFPRADKSLAQVMIDMEDSRNLPIQEATNVPMVAEASLPAAKATESAAADNKPSTDPAAGPRTSTSDPIAELSTRLTVGGSSAQSPALPTTPGPYTEAPASAPFNTAPAAAAASASDQPATITIDDFMKVELRVAKVLIAERIPKADKLLRLEVDLGTEKRQILSGIAQWYTPRGAHRAPHRGRLQSGAAQDARSGLPWHAPRRQRRSRRQARSRHLWRRHRPWLARPVTSDRPGSRYPDRCAD